jgi:hypothetical protein
MAQPAVPEIKRGWYVAAHSIIWVRTVSKQGSAAEHCVGGLPESCLRANAQVLNVSGGWHSQGSVPISCPCTCGAATALNAQQTSSHTS